MADSKTILDAKTINEFSGDLNSLYDVGLPSTTDFPNGSILRTLWETKITVTKGDKDNTYCAQADAPTIDFGIGVKIDATAIVKTAPEGEELEISTCKE